MILPLSIDQFASWSFWIWEEYAVPTILLVDDEVKVVEVVFGRTCFFPGFFRKDTIKFCGDDQFLPNPVQHEQA